jgi:SAM-dependent methyltransferase
MAELTTSEPLSSCCAPQAQAACCEPSEKESCCAANATGQSCGCAAGQPQGDIREVVREKYAAAARAAATQESTSCACGPAGTSDEQGAQVFGSALYDSVQTDGATETAVAASLGCGVPTAVADLHEGDTVLDLGSGAGADVLISAKRVGATGKAIGLDMTDEMLDLARANAEKAGATNVEFVKGTIEDVPLPDGAVDVVISNCVVNLSVDKPAVLAEMYRVLTPGGRIGISDVVAEDHLTVAERAERGSYVGCIAGALSRREYLEGLAAVGFEGASVEFTHEAAPGMHGAIVRATKPGALVA